MIQATATTAPYLVTRRTVNDDYDLIARKTQMDNILLIPGLDRPNPNNLFRDGQVGGWLDPYDLTKMWVDNAGTTPMTASDLGVGIGRIQTKGGPVITFEQTTSGDRLVWGRHPVSGIRQLLQYSEQLDNAAWSKVNVTVDPNTSETTDPFGGNNADKLTSTNIVRRLTQTFTGVSAGDNFVFEFYTKAGTTTEVQYRILNTAETVDSAGTFVFATESFTGALGPYVTSRSYTDEGNGWYRLSIFCTVPVGETTIRFNFGLPASGETAYGFGAQVSKGNTTTPYQKATTRFDITETGQPDLYYFSCNGVNQSWSSNATVDFSGTDKVTVWAGLRKLSDAADGTVCELTSGSLDGQIAIDAPGSATAAKYQGVSRGTVTAVPFTTNAAFNAPHTATLVLEGDIAAPLARLSINGTVVSTITTSQGSGNYANANLHIGRRAGSSRPYNGYIYSLIIAGDNYDTRTIQQFSDWSLKPRRLITA